MTAGTRLASLIPGFNTRERKPQAIVKPMSTDHDDVYLNGAHVPRHEATLSVEDRGTLFGDGVYEVIRYFGGRPLAMQAHLDRLRRSLAGIELPEPEDIARLPEISDALVPRNGLSEAKVYWQVTRGPGPRQHVMPDDPSPSVLVMTYPASPIDPQASCPAWRTTLVEDRRWGDCWIKSLMLLPNVLARSQAARVGCQEAIMQRDGVVTEGSSTNVFIATGGELRTHPADRHILGGVTRNLIIELAQQEGYRVRESACGVEQMLSADEVFLTGTTTHIAAVTHVGDQAIGDAQPGPMTHALHRALMQHVLETCAAPAGP